MVQIFPNTLNSDGSKVGNLYSETGYLREVRLKKNDQLWGSPMVRYSGPTIDHTIKRTLGNGVESEIYFDRQTLRPTRVATKAKTNLPNPGDFDLVDDYSISYTTTGSIQTITDHIDNSRSQSFSYDKLYRLTQAQSDMYGTLNYSFTAGGNLTLKDNVTLSYTNPARPQAVTSDGTHNYSYDNNGNMIVRQGRTLQYDGEDRLTKVIASSTVKEQYSYDHTGERVKKWREDGTVTYSIAGLYEITQPQGNADSNSWVHTKYIKGLNGDSVSQVSKTGVTPALFALNHHSVMSELTNVASVTGFISFVYHKITSYYFDSVVNPNSPRVRGREILLLFFGLTALALVFWMLKERNWTLIGMMKDDKKLNQRLSSSSASYPAFVRRLAPALVLIALFQFGFLGCSGTGGVEPVEDSDWNIETVVPVDTPDLATPLAGYNDTTLAGYPVSGTLFFVPSINGSTRLVTNAAGEVISRMEYKPYGEVVRDSNYSNGPDINRHKFSENEQDGETSLYFMSSRYYDPNLGIFIQTDKITKNSLNEEEITKKAKKIEMSFQFMEEYFHDAGSTVWVHNTYMYVRGNPINFIDPEGDFLITYAISLLVFGLAVGKFKTFWPHRFTGPSHNPDYDPKNPEHEGFSIIDDNSKIHDAEGALLGGGFGKFETSGDRIANIRKHNEWIGRGFFDIVSLRVVWGNIAKSSERLSKNWQAITDWANNGSGVRYALAPFAYLVVSSLYIIDFSYNIVYDTALWAGGTILFVVDNVITYIQEIGSHISTKNIDGQWRMPDSGIFKNLTSPTKWRVPGLSEWWDKTEFFFEGK